MRRVLALILLLPLPALAAHTGRTDPPGFELSDLALAACAAFGLWFVRRAMRARFRKRD